MTREFPEGSQVLLAEEGWALVKWDDSAEFVEGIRRLNGELEGRAEGTKALDFVGVSPKGSVYFIEFKDFRKHRIENKGRQPEELPLEVALKVRDTLAGVVAAFARGSRTADIDAVMKALASAKAPVRVLVCITEDHAPDQNKQKTVASQRLNGLKQRLSWLTKRVFVAAPEEVSRVAPGLRVENRSGEAQRSGG